MKIFLVHILIITFLGVNPNVLTSQTAPGILEENSTPPTHHQLFQVSFIPFFGTNGLQSPEITNTISLNILAGYNGGTTGIEIGGLVNIDRYEVKATQIAGIGNHGGETTQGVQIAGIYNISKIMTGTQIAGISNITQEFHGVQIAGINNHTPSGNAVQIGGLINLSNDKALFQLSGLLNKTKSCRGTQIAGLINTSHEHTGSQIAGILNISHSVKGVQIGLINIADSLGGIPLGLINISRNGYRMFEISADELFGANLAFRSGVEKFHAIITAGIQPHNIAAPLWSYGVGAGTSQALSLRLLLDIDATFHHIMKESDAGNNHLYRFYAGVDRKLNSRFSLILGVSYNFLVTDSQQPGYRDNYSDIAPYEFTDSNPGNANLKSWAGVKIGLRFR
jgi:hypothetical protein